jgi:hypothetical protein
LHRKFSLDDFGALFVQELVAAIGAEELDLLVSEFLIVAIKFAFALRASHPKNFCQSFDPWIFSRKDAKALCFGIKPIPKKNPILPSRLCAFAGESSSPVFGFIAPAR